MIFPQNQANNNNESSKLELFYEYFSLCLFARKKTIQFCNTKAFFLSNRKK